jgi:hypothetical protein
MPKQPAVLAAELGDYIQGSLSEVVDFNVVQGF